ncbi:MAG: hypothetical protein ACLFV7_01105 [Phycisphaerae bacterium]
MLDPETQRIVTEHRTLRNRLRAACYSQSPDPGLVFRIHASIREAEGNSTEGIRPGRMRSFWPAVASAAAVLLVVFAARTLLVTPRPAPGGQAKVTQAVLAHIHEEHSELGRPSIPFLQREQFVREIKAATGLTPLVPDSDRFTIRGGGAPIFFGEHAAAYVLGTPHGEVTVVVMRREPRALNFDHCWPVADQDGRMWACGFQAEKMVARRIGELTYCAVGRLTHEQLSAVVETIAASEQ